MAGLCLYGILQSSAELRLSNLLVHHRLKILWSIWIDRRKINFPLEKCSRFPPLCLYHSKYTVYNYIRSMLIFLWNRGINLGTGALPSQPFPPLPHPLWGIAPWLVGVAKGSKKRHRESMHNSCHFLVAMNYSQMGSQLSPRPPSGICLSMHYFVYIDARLYICQMQQYMCHVNVWRHIDTCK